MDFQDELPKAASIAWGLLLVFLGLATLAAPMATSVALTIVLAWVLMLAGLAHALSSWHAGTLPSVARRLTVGCVYFIAGFVIQGHPLWGVTSLTLILGVALLGESAIGLGLYFWEESRTISALLPTIATLILGVMIISQWPFSSLWTIGALVGANLLVDGAAQLFAAVQSPRTVA